MKCIFLLLIIYSISSAYSQFTFGQSSSDIEWKTLNNNYVEIYYPDYLESKAQYIANLIKHYKSVVGETYHISEPEKFNLILRAELADPNGFVTLGPRRSEWFSSSNITPFIGGLEWYQALAIHEYRHVVQFDHMFQGYNKGLYYFMGDQGRALGTVLTAPAWFFEGDAVWAETKYTDAGRGRSPRFSARMKALVDSGYMPKIDSFLAGNYEIPMPNHYVYGYFLNAKANKDFGPEIWKYTTSYSANSFPQPYKFYSSFEVKTGRDFDHFFLDTLLDIQDKNFSGEKKNIESYRDYAWPMVDGFFTYVLRKDLDSFWELVEINSGEEKKISELNITPAYSKPDLKRGYLTYTQVLPDRRYSFKSYSDIYLLSAYSKTNQRITFEKRYYHPKIHPTRNEIFAVHFDEKNNWSVESLDFSGKILNKLQLANLTINEFVFKNDNELIVLAQENNGYKSLYQVSLNTQNLKKLTDSTRNNIFGLNFDTNSIYFEADYQGKVETFALDLNNQSLSKCSNAKYAEFNPYITKGVRHYVELDAAGKIYKSEQLSCTKVNKNSLIDTNLYISKNEIGDNFIQSEPIVMKDFSTFHTEKVKSDKYKRSDDILNLHSWSFFGGRGFQLEGFSNNYLGDISVNGAVGMDSEENRPFSYLNLTYSPYYPIWGIGIDYAKRNVDYIIGDNDEFTEVTGLASVTLPYFWRDNLFSGALALQLAGGILSVSERERNKVYEASDETFNITMAQLDYINIKDLRYREILPSAGFTYTALAKVAQAKEDEDFSNYLTYQKATLYKNGFAANHGIKLSLEEERQRDSLYSYRITSPSSEVNQYVFARGYEYHYTPHFFKGSLNYAFPLVYTQAQWDDWIIFNRISSNLFYDYTKTELDDYHRTFNSYGAEIFFDSLTFRLLPITYGLRFLNKEQDHETVAEVFLGLGIQI